MDGGALTGPIPTGFAQCYPELTELDLSYNFLTGGWVGGWERSSAAGRGL